MQYIQRQLESGLQHHLDRGKSILLLGPRQTGKSTLLARLSSDLTLSLASPGTRQRYEKNSSLLIGEIEALAKKTKRPLVFLDEVQKVPTIMDAVQDLIDRHVAQFILTGSSARKLRKGRGVNLLPGRVVSMRLDPFLHQEYAQPIEMILTDGTLPGIVQEREATDREVDLKSYVETYLEEEIRAEAIVRNIGSFARFLEFAGLESGNIINLHGLSQEMGVSHTTIASYFEILDDCLIAERIEPITQSLTRKKLTKSNRYLMFDLGVRRLCAGEGRSLSRDRLGNLFEQYVGLELIRLARLKTVSTKIRFWRDPDGPEVDWVIERGGEYIPIEVKWNDRPSRQDIRHLKVFLKEYKKAKKGYVVCRTPRPVKLEEEITAIPWQQLSETIDS
ncbi:MAG: ATP-binding protein [Deltaproteobacteria bacterium]|nr:ATP-binding protein [Deltaproteobacteria bacterium]